MRRLLSVAVCVAGLPAATATAATPREQVRAALAQAGFTAAVADQGARAVKSTIVLQRTVRGAMPAARGTSRLGGHPDLPAGRVWPRCRGKAQTFLGQVRVADLPAAAAPLRRLGGVVLFFSQIDFEDPAELTNPWDGGRCTAVIHVRRGTALRRQRPPKGQAVLRLRHASLRFTARPDIPDIAYDSDRLGYPLHNLRLTDLQQDAWWDVRTKLIGSVRDPEHRLLGYTGVPNGGNGCWERTRRGRDPWAHVMTFGYDEQLGFEVADAGVLRIAVRLADLRRGKLGRTCGIFDSA